MLAMNDFKDIKVAVARIGYVGLSIVTLLSQHHYVTSVEAIHIFFICILIDYLRIHTIEKWTFKIIDCYLK